MRNIIVINNIPSSTFYFSIGCLKFITKILIIQPIPTPFCKPKIRQYKIITIARNVGNSSTIFVLVGFAGDSPCLVGEEPGILLLIPIKNLFIVFIGREISITDCLTSNSCSSKRCISCILP